MNFLHNHYEMDCHELVKPKAQSFREHPISVQFTLSFQDHPLESVKNWVILKNLCFMTTRVNRWCVCLSLNVNDMKWQTTLNYIQTMSERGYMRFSYFIFWNTLRKMSPPPDRYRWNGCPAKSHLPLWHPEMLYLSIMLHNWVCWNVFGRRCLGCEGIRAI